MTARVVKFRTRDGLRLEGRLSAPPGARGAAVLCHAPEPPSGLMPNVLMPAINRALESAGWASLRFNYRGVGRSEGTFEAGTKASADVLAAIAFTGERFPNLPRAVIAWSAGAVIALNACLGETTVDSFVAIAPPISVPLTTGVPGIPDRQTLMSWRTRTLLIAGSNDERCRPADLEALAEAIGSDVETLDGADHGFAARLADLSARITWFLR